MKTGASGAQLYPALARAITLGFVLYLLVLFLESISLVILVFLLGFILATALNPPVTWFEEKGVARPLATGVVLAGVLAVAALLGWLTIPRLASELAGLLSDLPDYIQRVGRSASHWLDQYPQLSKQLEQGQDAFSSDKVLKLAPGLAKTLARVGQYSLSLVGAVILILLLFSIVLYTLSKPRQLLTALFQVVPLTRRAATERALVGSSEAIMAWLWSNVLVGAGEAVLAGIVLSLLGVPAALVWAALTFFAELIPNLGAYIMSIPPILVALAVDPMIAVWVALFYIAVQQISGHFVTPYIRASKMCLHPVTLLFALLAMGMAFGLLGAVISTPVAGIVAAFYDEFFLAHRPPDGQTAARVDRVLRRERLKEKPSAPDTESSSALREPSSREA